MAAAEWEPCHQCGQSESFQIDGYNYAERILEGVMFTVTIENGKFVVTYPGWEDHGYLSSINMKKYFREIAKDLDHTALYCHHCNTSQY